MPFHSFAAYITGLFIGCTGGIVVLVSYYLQRSNIIESAQQLQQRKNVYYGWMTSAIITAICFLLVGALWAMSDENVVRSETQSIVFVIGLAIFMAGAITWPWVLVPDHITIQEWIALGITAAGSLIMWGASLFQIMALPFTTYIMFHHVFVDGIWWPLYGRKLPVQSAEFL